MIEYCLKRIMSFLDTVLSRGCQDICILPPLILVCLVRFDQAEGAGLGALAAAIAQEGLLMSAGTCFRGVLSPSRMILRRRKSAAGIGECHLLNL